MLQRLRSLAETGWNESVIRRATALLAFTLPATALNLALTWSASHLLDPDGFGIFYTAITIINILFAPAVIVNLFFSRFVATAYASLGPDQGRGSVPIMLRTMSGWLGVGSVVGLAVVLAVGVVGGLFSPVLGVIMIAVVVTSYFAECGRIILQGEHKFIRLGLYTLSWMAGRFLFGVIGLWLFGTVWGGLAGVILSAPFAFIAFIGVSPFRARPVDDLAQAAPRLAQLFPLALGYAVFAAVAHADIVLAYLTMEPVQLGIYSGSSVLPKGLLMVTLPIIQLAFPVMVYRQVGEMPTGAALTKGLMMTASVLLAGVLMTLVLSDPICSSRYGLGACDPLTMTLAALAMVPFGLLRFLISADFSANRDWIPSLLLVPLAALLAIGLGISWDPQGLAMMFCLFSLATLVLYPLLHLVRPFLIQRRAQSRQQRQTG